ncbi:unnamed protein product [Allacma fusca]|uniref:Uncharacterized protein n=1 Tax=Allacma fusca TaxID=39272 RepID=A0A8J2JI73_9HEXA|nr:unnamed protein product [Allacma fusca]
MDEPMPADEAEEPRVWVNGEIFEPQKVQADHQPNEEAQSNGDAHPEHGDQPRVQLDPEAVRRGIRRVNIINRMCNWMVEPTPHGPPQNARPWEFCGSCYTCLDSTVSQQQW